MIDLMQPNMQPIQNIEKNLVYSGSKQNVKMTMIARKSYCIRMGSLISWKVWKTFHEECKLYRKEDTEAKNKCSQSIGDSLKVQE